MKAWMNSLLRRPDVLLTPTQIDVAVTRYCVTAAEQYAISCSVKPLPSTRATAGALARMKQLFAAAGTNTLHGHLDLEARWQGDSGRTADYTKGLRAFQEKRPPVFNG
jgi:enoyl-CoA hydratase/carnithine racemase